MLAAAPAAEAAPRFAGSAASTITACRGDGFTATASVRSLSARTRRPARVPGTRLQVRLDAVPLFGLPKPGQWKDLGSRSSGTVTETFSGLSFDTWTAVIRYRYRRGRRSLLSGDQRSESRRVGRSRGRAFCILPEGSKPRDTRAPSVFLFPSDERWRHGPVTVAVAATDDFSGVAQLIYRVDGGPLQPIRNGGTFELVDEGSHVVELAAGDTAGNWSPTLTQTLRVDSTPPSAPGISLPRPVTAATRPEIRWAASTDSASGVQGYYVAVKRADGSTAGAQNVGPETTSIPSPAELQDGQSYRVEVTAFDGADPAWVAGSGVDFRVDTSPEVTGATPAAGSVLRQSESSTDFQLHLDRPADPATVGESTVSFDRRDGADPGYTVDCAGSPCTTIVIDPDAALDEGHYTASLNGVKSEEGTTFNASPQSWAVAFWEDGGFSVSSSGAGVLCTAGTRTDTFVLTTSVPAETGRLEFTWSGTSNWTVQALDTDDDVLGTLSGNAAGSPGSRARLDYALGQKSGASLRFVWTVPCPEATLTVSDVLASRNP